MSSVVLLPAAPPPPPPGPEWTLADAVRETASRVGPFFDLTATAGAPDAVVVAGLRTSAPVGGYEGLYLLRREAVRDDDRVRQVDRFDGPTGALVVDFPYEDSPVAGERVELHHLHPDQQVFVDVQAALRRCYLLDILAVTPPPDVAVAVGLVGADASDPRARIYEVNGNGWVVYTGNGNGNGTPPPPSSSAVPANGTRNGVLSSFAGVTDRSGAGAPVAVVDLTAQAFWLFDTRQILGVASAGLALAPCGRYGNPSSDGWTCFSNRGRVYLGIPAGVPLDALTVRAYRDAYGLVNGLDDPAGPRLDADELAVPLDYVCAFAHIEAWRRHRDRLEASAAEGRFATQIEAAAEATRVASIYADFLFRPQTERGDRIASPWGAQVKPSPSGLGGTGALAGAVVNQNNWGREP